MRVTLSTVARNNKLGIVEVNELMKQAIVVATTVCPVRVHSRFDFEFGFKLYGIDEWNDVT